MRQTVLLGPHVDLHPGYHGSLDQDPPESVTLYRRGARHHFLLPPGHQVRTAHDLFAHPHLGELVDFGPGPQVVHSARWPVVGRHAWIVDMDDFGYPVLLGRYAIRAAVQSEDGDPWRRAAATVRRRLALMLSAYAHPSCKAILFWTRHALRDAERWIERLGMDAAGEAFVAKSRVVYPAQRPMLLPTAVEAKWSRPSPLAVLFVGNDYEAKNGRLALRVFQRLRNRHPEVRFTYVGQVAAEDLPLTSGLTHRTDLPRAEVLALLRSAHVLFHPARTESFGMVLLEAAASGLAIVAARGRGMPHMEELFDERQALLVDRGATAPQEEEGLFERHLAGLLSTPSRARALGLAAYQAATEGALGLGARNAILADLYHRAAIDAAPEALTLARLAPRDLETLRFASETVRDAQLEYRQRHGITRVNFYVPAGALPAATEATAG